MGIHRFTFWKLDLVLNEERNQLIKKNIIEKCYIKKGKFKKFKFLQKEWTEFVYSSLKGPAGRATIALSYTSYREAKTEMN